MLSRALALALAAALAVALLLAGGQQAALAGGGRGMGTTYGGGPAPPDPAVLAALARQTLGLPSPVIRSSPEQNALQLTNLPTWLWVNPADWVPESKMGTVPGESVTATATLVSVTWRPGDGSAVTCRGAGTPYTSADNPAAVSPSCGHTYTAPSAGQPGGAFRATATITWNVTWQGAGARAGCWRRCSRLPQPRSGWRSPRR